MLEKDKGSQNTAKIIIRLMEIDDIPSVYHIGEQLFTSEEFPILYRTWDPYEVTSNFTSDPEYCYVAESSGMVVGFILGTTIEKEGTAWKKYGYINWIGISDDFQRRKLGQRLYKKVEQALRKEGIRMMLVDTEEENAEAVHFFKSLGFFVRGKYVWLSKTLRKSRSKKHLPA